MRISREIHGTWCNSKELRAPFVGTLSFLREICIFKHFQTELRDPTGSIQKLVFPKEFTPMAKNGTNSGETIYEWTRADACGMTIVRYGCRVV